MSGIEPGKDAAFFGPTREPWLGQAAHWWGIDREIPSQGMVLDFLQQHAQDLADHLCPPESRQEWFEQANQILSPRLHHSLGLTRLPPDKPHNIEVVGEIEQPAYTIQKIVYETYPGLWVSAHLYLPKSATRPVPAVLYSPGHWMENGKLAADIQIFCANLASLGLAAMVCDPIGQGERLGDWRDHGHLEPLLVGISQEGLMVWESMRAIDFLSSRPEIDASRIGMTGASGGGLNTFYTSAVDPRIQVSVPVCYVTTFSMMMQAVRDRNWEDGTDLCNQVPEVMAFAEMSDICGLFSPKPLCIVAGVRDWMFPVQGSRQVYKTLKHIYQLQEAEQNLKMVEIDAEHGFDRNMREAAYGWFRHWLTGEGNCKPLPEKEFDLLEEPYPPALTYMDPPGVSDLAMLRNRSSYPISNVGLCFATGKAPPAGPVITDLAQDLAQAAQSHHACPFDETLKSWADHRQVVLQKAGAIIGRFPSSALVKDQTFNQVIDRDIFAERVVFESEPGIEIPATFFMPANWEGYTPTVIYVDEWGKQVGLDNGIIESFLSANLAVLAIDVRGTGETAVSDFEAATNALMTDRPLFGQRVWDVIRSVDYLWRRIFISPQIDKGRIACVGRGMGALLCLYAAALDERISASVLWQCPTSYRSLIVGRPAFPPSAYLFDVLNNFDLPQLLATLAPRPLLLKDAVDGERRTLHESQLSQDWQWPQHIYRLYDAEQGLELRIQDDSGQESNFIARWLAMQL